MSPKAVLSGIFKKAGGKASGAVALAQVSAGGVKESAVPSPTHPLCSHLPAVGLLFSIKQAAAASASGVGAARADLAPGAGVQAALCGPWPTRLSACVSLQPSKSTS